MLTRWGDRIWGVGREEDEPDGGPFLERRLAAHAVCEGGGLGAGVAFGGGLAGGRLAEVGAGGAEVGGEGGVGAEEGVAAGALGGVVVNAVEVFSGRGGR